MNRESEREGNRWGGEGRKKRVKWTGRGGRKEEVREGDR